MCEQRTHTSLIVYIMNLRSTLQSCIDKRNIKLKKTKRMLLFSPPPPQHETPCITQNRFQMSKPALIQKVVNLSYPLLIKTHDLQIFYRCTVMKTNSSFVLFSNDKVIQFTGEFIMSCPILWLGDNIGVYLCQVLTQLIAEQHYKLPHICITSRSYQVSANQLNL